METNNNQRQDVRWLQRFSNYRKALVKLGKAVDIISSQMEEDEEIDDLLAKYYLEEIK